MDKNTTNRLAAAVLAALSAVLIFGCELPKDKIIEYSAQKGAITGFVRPTYAKVAGNHLYVCDEDGLYRFNLAQVDFSGDTIMTYNYFYRNFDSELSTYGSAVNFEVTDNAVFVITYNSSSSQYYLVRLDLNASEPYQSLQHFALPNKRSAGHISACEDAVVVSGNANVAIKGFVTKDDGGAVLFDTTTDYSYTYDYHNVDNITVSTMKPLIYKDGSKYIVYIISGDTDNWGIRRYFKDADLTSDRNIYLTTTYKTDLYPMDIRFKPNDTSYIISSEASRVNVYKITDNSDDSATFTLANSIAIGTDNGALKTVAYGDKLICLYGYSIKANEYDKHAYDILAYWFGAKVIEDPYTPNARVTKTYPIEGWGVDCAVFGQYLLAVNQVKNCINIISLDD